MLSTLAIIECNKSGNVEIIYYIKNILNVLRIAVPIILIVICMFDVLKTVMSDLSKENKLNQKLFRRFFAAAIIFLLPSLINIVMSISNGINFTSDTCWTEATKENIEKLKLKEIEEADKNTGDIQTDIDTQRNSKAGTGNVNTYTKKARGTTNDSAKSSQNEGTAYIFLGDSRTAGMSTAVGNQDKVKWVAKVGEGYNWLTSNAVNTVNNTLPSSGAYIFANFGINDLGNISSYISKYKQLAQNDWKNHKLVIVSVGPKVGSGCYPNVSNSAIENFNQQLKNGLSSISNIYYCDTYNGFGASNFKVTGACEIHYTTATSVKLYNYIMDNCRP